MRNLKPLLVLIISGITVGILIVVTLSFLYPAHEDPAQETQGEKGKP